MPRQLQVGDQVKIGLDLGSIIISDHKITIGEILYQEPWEWRNAYYIEFKDTNGKYHFWKQNFDGGEAILQA